MAEYTEHYGLKILGPGEHFSEDSYQYTRADRRLIDRLLRLGAESHRHTGGVTDRPTVDSAPLLVVDTQAGSMPPGQRYFYRYTLVDADGFESTASPEAFIDTAPGVDSPAAPTAVIDTGGSLPPGNFYYILSAYTDFDNLETVAGPGVFVSVPYANGNTNRVTLTLPTLPRGATGFNVYRRTPSGGAYYHIDSIDMTTGPTTYVDDGTAQEDCDRMAPEISTALARNAIVITLPGDAPAVPAGYAWRIYRTTRAGDYSNSLLTTIADGAVTFTDTGIGTSGGQPPTVGISPGAPERVDLTNGTEVQGRLPLAAVSAFPHEITFSFPGPVEPVQGTQTWICPFPQATLFCVRPVLGRDVTAVGDVSVNVVVKQYGYDTWLNVLNVPATIPEGYNDVLVGGDAFAISEIQTADLIAVDVVASDPTNVGLTVVIGMHLYGWTSMISHTWAPLR